MIRRLPDGSLGALGTTRSAVTRGDSGSFGSTGNSLIWKRCRDGEGAEHAHHSVVDESRDERVPCRRQHPNGGGSGQGGADLTADQALGIQLLLEVLELLAGHVDDPAHLHPVAP